ncbi:MAG: TAXI family TRAP transporter solute-binding subunit [Pirellulaceae bacterium]
MSEQANNPRGPRRSAVVRRFFVVVLANLTAITAAVLFAAALVAWVFYWDTIPRRIRIATADASSEYNRFGDVLEDPLSKRTGRTVEVLQTAGTLANLRGLESGDYELALVQDGAYDPDEHPSVVLITPVHGEVVFLLARKTSLAALGETLFPIYRLFMDDNVRIFIGAENSGMQQSARIVAEHYGLTAAGLESRRIATWDEARTDADLLIATTGPQNRLLHDLLLSGQFEMLPIDADAIAARHPYFEVVTIPRGHFGHAIDGPAPRVSIPTLQATAWLATREDASNQMVTAVLEAIYREGVARKWPDLMARDEAQEFAHRRRLHAAATAFHDPFDPGPVASWVEAAAGSYDLLFAVGAGCFFLWTLIRRRRQLGQQRQRDHDKRRLSTAMDAVRKIEQEEAAVDDPVRLTELMKQLTALKLEALDDLTDNEIHDEQLFGIFLTQCASVSNKILLKTLVRSTSRAEGIESVADAPQ